MVDGNVDEHRDHFVYLGPPLHVRHFEVVLTCHFGDMYSKKHIPGNGWNVYCKTDNLSPAICWGLPSVKVTKVTADYAMQLRQWLKNKLHRLIINELLSCIISSKAEAKDPSMNAHSDINLQFLSSCQICKTVVSRCSTDTVPVYLSKLLPNYTGWWEL